MVVQELLQAVLRQGPLLDFPVGVAFCGLVEGDLGKNLVNGDAHEELTEIVLVGDRKVAVPGMAEEGPKNGLNNVFGAKTGLQPCAERYARHRHEAVGSAVDD